MAAPNCSIAGAHRTHGSVNPRRHESLPTSTAGVVLAQWQLRLLAPSASVLGQHELDELLSQRDRLNAKLQTDLARETDPWGVKIERVEVKHIDLPPEMQRAMAKQAEAEREKRAKVIHAEGEMKASEQLSMAADVMSKNSVTLQLRYLQTLTEIAAEKNSTIIFPMPIELLKGMFTK